MKVYLQTRDPHDAANDDVERGMRKRDETCIVKSKDEFQQDFQT
jgi:hypothetical protein